MKTVEERENQIRLVAQLSDDLSVALSKEALLSRLCAELFTLRHLSIQVVELIVLWRDQLKQICAMATLGSKVARKRRLQLAILTPYLTSCQENYLLKMKTDTLEFSKLAIAQHFNFGAKLGDPFLI